MSIAFYTAEYIFRTTWWTLFADFWPITSVFLLLAWASLRVGSPFQDRKFRQFCWSTAIAYLLTPMATTLIAIILRDTESDLSWRTLVLLTPLAIYLLFGMAAAAITKDRRLRAIALLAPGAWAFFWLTVFSDVALGGIGG